MHLYILWSFLLCLIMKPLYCYLSQVYIFVVELNGHEGQVIIFLSPLDSQLFPCIFQIKNFFVIE